MARACSLGASTSLTVTRAERLIHGGPRERLAGHPMTRRCVVLGRPPDAFESKRECLTSHPRL